MRILIVEDERLIANSIKKGLELEHYAVDVAHTGSDGYDLASTGDFDCLILDLMLPGLDGLQICQKLRRQNIHTPILILTAKSQTQDKVTLLNQGADDYLTKPFAFEELLARLRALTRRPHQTSDPVLILGNLSLNTVSFEVKHGNKSVRLSSKEFALLECLMRHQNRILTKDQIIQQVWNYDANVLPNTVEVYIKNLRHKIPNLIHTVRGFGYKIGEK
ncbi:MAG: response regulator transcription factor [Candidatus Shapirobacteria bacterium]|jgi:DNA-binding response OmpR family regulator